MNRHALFAAALRAQKRSDWDEARARYREILALGGDHPEVHYNLGLIGRGCGRLDDALGSYARALALQPDFPQAENNMGNVLRMLMRLDEALAAYQRAVALKPDYAEAWSNLGATLRNLGRVDEAMPCFRRAVDLQPQNPSLQSNYLYALHFQEGADPGFLATEHAAWGTAHADPLGAHTHPHGSEGSPGRRLRIGYVSSAFRDHCQSFFSWPLLANHDHRHVEIFCYSDVAHPDAVTEKLRPCADTWRDIAGLGDPQVADMIRSDHIDVLVDLMLHLPENRLLAFARRPAPVQVTWLGYPGGTGMAAMDYRLTDPWLDPPGRGDSAYRERSWRLPDTFWCYDSLSGRRPPRDLPARGAGFVTFGCLNSFSKVNATVLGMWARILRSVPGSRLRLLAPPGDARLRVLRALEVDASRIEFREFLPRALYLDSYGPIDLCLDTFPYNGHTTSLDAFWLGVPVVSLCGATAVSRAGLSQASNLGMPGLVAQSPGAYVDIAVGLAGDLGRLEALRASLRARFDASALSDGPRFARNVEAAYRAMWAKRCAGRPP